jgi:hypothetical protein
MSLSALIDKRRQAHEEQDHGYEHGQQPQYRSRYAQHAHAEGVNLDERQQHQKLEAEYRAHNLGAGQATVEQMENWHKEHTAKQAPAQQVDAKAERDWEVSAHRAQNQERAQADISQAMPVVKPKLPDLSDDAVLSQVNAQQQDLTKGRGLRR